MAKNSYYPEEVLIEKMESGEYGWLDYVNHFSAEWQEELAAYCAVCSPFIVLSPIIYSNFVQKTFTCVQNKYSPLFYFPFFPTFASKSSIT